MGINKDNSLAENKVLILYILENINDNITSSNLFRIMSSINDINYFYYRQLLIDLVESKLVGTYTNDDLTVYEITSEGKNSLELTIDVLPGLLKLKADNVLKDEIKNIINDSAITAEYIPDDEKHYTVKGKIIENNKTVFEFQTFAGSNEHAKLIADNWKTNAYEIYPQILNLLTGNK